MKFSVNDIPDLKGKVAIVTGANTGIGKITALELARKNAHVFLACRSEERAAPAIKEIIETTGNKQVEFLALDLSDLVNINAAVKTFTSRKLPLHILVNNAGIMALPEYKTTANGIEMQWGTNHVGHFAFTNGLLPIIEKSAPSRIVNVSSMAHKNCDPSVFASMESLQKLNEPKSYSSWTTYGNSKISNLLFSLQLDKKIRAKGIDNVYVNSLHPGVINTELMRNMPWYLRMLTPVFSLFFLTPENGALTQLYCATHPDIEENKKHAAYYVPFGKEEQPIDLAKDESAAERLWKFTEKIIAEKTA